MRINNNISAMNTYSRLTSAQGAQSKSLEKLSSGLRINRAGDDAAGLAISEKMRGQIKGLNQAVRNAQDGISLIQTAEGGLNETHSILQRMRELTVQSANDTNTTEDRQNIQDEMDQLAGEITRIADNTAFNGKTQKLLDGNFTATFHIGANSGQHMSLTIGQMDAAGLGVGGTSVTSAKNNLGADIVGATFSTTETGTTTVLKPGEYTVVDLKNKVGYDGYETGLADNSGKIVAVGQNAAGDDKTTANVTNFVSVDDKTKTVLSGTAGSFVKDSKISVAGKGIDIRSAANANIALDSIDTAIKEVSEERSKLGAMQNRLDHTINNLTTTSENLSAAESRIRDVDMAKEMMEFTKNNILNQASTAMLAQANQMPQGVLQLLG